VLAEEAGKATQIGGCDCQSNNMLSHTVSSSLLFGARRSGGLRLLLI
jgi:hypothetical protein